MTQACSRVEHFDSLEGPRLQLRRIAAKKETGATTSPVSLSIDCCFKGRKLNAGRMRPAAAETSKWGDAEVAATSKNPPAGFLGARFCRRAAKTRDFAESSAPRSSGRQTRDAFRLLRDSGVKGAALLESARCHSIALSYEISARRWHCRRPHHLHPRHPRASGGGDFGGNSARSTRIRAPKARKSMHRPSSIMPIK